MSTSNCSTRSNSIETTAECVSELGSPRNCSAPLLKEGQEDQENRGTLDSLDSLPTSSPPPSYEYALRESRLSEQNAASSPTNPVKGPEIYHKSSKKLYKAVAKQFGITCKMSDECRCFDCQSHYFDCEYEKMNKKRQTVD